MNRAERRRSAINDHPAYLWAIESDRPRWWAVELAASYNTYQLNFRREQQLGHRLTFTKFTGIKIKVVTAKAILVAIRDGEKDTWIPRSNIRSDDDKRMSEVDHQLLTRNYITTNLHIADWFAKAEGLVA